MTDKEVKELEQNLINDHDAMVRLLQVVIKK